jgi:hypothetical protein
VKQTSTLSRVATSFLRTENQQNFVCYFWAISEPEKLKLELPLTKELKFDTAP